MPVENDMTEYHSPSTIPPGVQALNVGWLGRETDFLQGDAPEGFIEALTELCAHHSTNKMRGWQRCQLSHAKQAVEYPVQFTLRGEEFALGDAEVRVPSPEGSLLVAPNLILHYVTDHKYLPPQKFIESVMKVSREDATGPTPRRRSGR